MTHRRLPNGAYSKTAVIAGALVPWEGTWQRLGGCFWAGIIRQGIEDIKRPTIYTVLNFEEWLNIFLSKASFPYVYALRWSYLAEDITLRAYCLRVTLSLQSWGDVICKMSRGT
jgi:hypothetical protein